MLFAIVISQIIFASVYGRRSVPVDMFDSTPNLNQSTRTIDNCKQLRGGIIPVLKTLFLFNLRLSRFKMETRDTLEIRCCLGLNPQRDMGRLHFF